MVESAKVVSIKDGESKLLRALLRARKNFKPVKKDAANTFYKGAKYATLGAYIEAVEDALTNEDLLVLPTFSVLEGRTHLELSISHPCGESLRSGPYPLNPTKDTPDQYGSALSYARRYILSSLLNLVSEDDDGHAASGHGEKAESKPEKKADPPTIQTTQTEHPDMGEFMTAASKRWSGKGFSAQKVVAHVNRLVASANGDKAMVLDAIANGSDPR